MKPAITVEVTCCAECPYVAGEEQPWVCAADDPGQTIGTVTAPWPPPPAWCPLRVANRLVTLRVP